MVLQLAEAISPGKQQQQQQKCYFTTLTELMMFHFINGMTLQAIEQKPKATH